MPPPLGPRALSVLASAPTAQGLKNLSRIAEEPCGLQDRGSFVFASLNFGIILALISADELDALNLHQLFDARQLPRGCPSWMLMEEVEVILKLLEVERGHEIDVYLRLDSQASHPGSIVASCLVKLLPRAECPAFWRADQQERLLLLPQSTSFLAFFWAAKIPWHAILRVHYRQIERESWQ